MLRNLPEEVGVRLGNATINAAAFADDLLLFAATPESLQLLIDNVADYLAECGMTINALKSMTVSIKASAHIKKTAVDPDTRFKCRNEPLPSLKRSDQWKYLGVYFTPEGRVNSNLSEILRPMLGSLTRAPLKPQ